MAEGAVADLYVQLGANIAGFQRGMDEAGAKAVELEGKIGALKAETDFSKVGGGGGLFGGLLGKSGNEESRLRGMGEHFAVVGEAAHTAHEHISGLIGAGELLAPLAGISIAGFAFEGSKHFEETGHAAYELSEKFGLIPQQASALLAAGEQVGVANDSMSIGLKFLAKDMLAAQDALSKHTKTMPPAVAALKELGINVFDSSGHMRDMNGVMTDAASAFAAMPDGAEKAALAIRIFGRSGTDMLPVLNEGSQGLADLESQAQSTGAALSGPQVEAAQKAYEAHKKMDEGIHGLENSLATLLAPALTALAPQVQRFAAWFSVDGVAALQRFGGWISDNVIPVLRQFAAWFSDNVIPVLQRFAGWVNDNVVPALQRLGTWIEEQVIPALSRLWGYFQENIVPILANVWQAIQNVWSALQPVAEKLAPVIGAFVQLVERALNPMVTATGLIWKGIAALTPLLSPLESAWSGTFGRMLGPIQGVMDFVGRLLDKLNDALKALDRLTGAGHTGDFISGSLAASFSPTSGGNLPHAAARGMVANGATFTMIGEAGPEAVLNRMQLAGLVQAGGARITGPININVSGADDPQVVAYKVRDALLTIARQQGIPSLFSTYA